MLVFLFFGGKLFQDLGVDTLQDGYDRARKTEIELKLFRMFKKKLTWSPVTSKNIALFFGDETAQRDEFASTIVKQLYKMPENARVTYIDTAGDGLAMMKNLTKNEQNFITFIPATNMTNTVLARLSELHTYIRSKSRERGMVEITNRKLSFIFLNLSDHDMRLIAQNPTLTRVFETLVTNAHRERLYVIPLVRSAQTVPRNILEDLEWAVFLGGENALYCRNDLHSDLGDSLYSVSQIVIGIAFTNTYKSLITVHPITFTPTAWHLQRLQQTINENTAFEGYLNSLDDGSIA